MSVAAVSISRNTTTCPPIASCPDHKALIEDVARRCFIELAVSLAICTAAVLFTATSLHGTLIFAAIAVQTICNAALRYADAMAAKQPESEESQWVRAACRYLCPTMFAYLTAVNAQTLIHESGHAAAAKCLFQDAKPEITITPCLGGLTRFSTTNLTSFGEGIGRNNAMLITTIMGPAATLFVSGIAIAVGLAVQTKWPELGYYLISVGRGDFYAHSFYALTGMSSAPGTQAHDFVRLKAYGIHPLASAIAILAIPALITKAFEKTEPSKSTQPISI